MQEVKLTDLVTARAENSCLPDLKSQVLFVT